MFTRFLSPLLATLAILAAAPGAEAAAIPFSGSIQNVTPPGVPGGRCGPPPNLTLTFAPDNTSGVSNLGAFTVSASHCVVPTPPVSNYGDGEFTWFFEAGDTLMGTYTGTFTIVPGAPAETMQDYVITGGTGRFDRASGSFRHVGTVTFGQGGATTGQSVFEGQITPIPEPATWGMLILGFGAIGGLVRRRWGLPAGA
jgi:hypothetical protein